MRSRSQIIWLSKKLGCVGDSFDDVVSEILHKVRHNNIKTTAIEHGDGIATSSHELDGESEHD